MPANPLTVSQVAAQLQLSPATVRRYTTHFQRHLSDGASPAPGARRELSDLDLYILRRCPCVSALCSCFHVSPFIGVY